MGSLAGKSPSSTYKSLLKKSTEPVIRTAVKKAVTILARQFVFKPTIEEGMKFTESEKYKKNIFSFFWYLYFNISSISFINSFTVNIFLL